MKKIRFDDCICHSNLKGHSLIKDRILDEIEKDPVEEFGFKKSDSYLSDDIFKLDHRISEMGYEGPDKSEISVDRKWVDIFLPHFTESLESIMHSMGYLGLNLHQVWYQQYLRDNYHGWHIHQWHFTGVYYLEFPKGSADTIICSPYDLKPKKINVKEGDIIVFPGHWIHRAPPNTSERKTIVSFNFDAHMDQINVKAIKKSTPWWKIM